MKIKEIFDFNKNFCKYRTYIKLAEITWGNIFEIPLKWSRIPASEKPSIECGYFAQNIDFIFDMWEKSYPDYTCVGCQPTKVSPPPPIPSANRIVLAIKTRNAKGLKTISALTMKSFHREGQSEKERELYSNDCHVVCISTIMLCAMGPDKVLYNGFQ